MQMLSQLIRMAPLGFIAAACFTGAPAHAQNATLSPQTPAGEYEFVDFGRTVATRGRTTAVGTNEDPGPGWPEQPAWTGDVRIYTTDANRSAWTLVQTLHADDNSPE